MLKRMVLYFLFAFAHTNVWAQNLVPNPGFEEYNDCPQARSAIAYSDDYTDFPSATWWVSALWNTTPDYYNKCATNPLVTLPYNTYNDYQEPHGGVACAGISMFSGFPQTPTMSDYREYLETKLSQPLQAGKKYFVSFFVNFTFHLPETANQIVVDLVGAQLTDTQIAVAYPFGQPELYLHGKRDVVNERNTFLSDTAKWTQLSGIYTAHGGEQWLTIGYYKDSLPINYTILYTRYPGVPDSIHSTCYMYIDDVCISEIGQAAHDTIYTNSFPAAITVPVADVRYLWSTGDSTGLLNVDEPGTYWVESTGDCLYRTDTITILCLPDSSATSNLQVVSSFPVEISGSLSGGTHSWSTGATSNSIVINSPGTYWVESYENCRYVVDTIVVLCEPDVFSDTLIYASRYPLELAGHMVGDSILWGDGGNTQATMINYGGTYTVTVWIGCQRYIHTITVLDRDVDDCIWMPTAFTPNGDGKNDTYGPVFSCYNIPAYYSLRIYNRYGECVFDTEDVQGKWDGNYKGTKAEIGAYYYILRYTHTPQGLQPWLNPGKLSRRKGDVTLIR